MFYLNPNTQQRYRIGTPFEYNGVQYTKAGASHATFMSLGFTQVVPQQRPDSRFYVVSGPDSTGAYTSSPRPVEDLKTQYKLQQKQQAHNVLRRTDWYVIRSTELGVVAASVPTAVSTFRSTTRTIADARCAQIDACGTTPQLETLIKAPAEIRSNPQDPNSPMITNPAAMMAWPEPLASTYDHF
jgi:hypothetical protein